MTLTVTVCWHDDTFMGPHTTLRLVVWPSINNCCYSTIVCSDIDTDDGVVVCCCYSWNHCSGGLMALPSQFTTIYRYWCLVQAWNMEGRCCCCLHFHYIGIHLVHSVSVVNLLFVAYTQYIQQHCSVLFICFWCRYTHDTILLFPFDAVVWPHLTSCYWYLFPLITWPVLYLSILTSDYCGDGDRGRRCLIRYLFVVPATILFRYEHCTVCVVLTYRYRLFR